ncbi:MAG TPA: hypothetical protein ENN33_10540, partial [Ignavibacteria bacterium]|nr:hypothetical protein [Ignavibacteria bacterium]
MEKIIALLLLFVGSLFAQQPIQFLTNIPNELGTDQTLQIIFTADQSIVQEYRYKLQVPFSWKGALSYAMNTYTEWRNYGTETVTYKNFTAEGEYEFIVEYKTWTNTKSSISKKIKITKSKIEYQGQQTNYSQSNLSANSEIRIKSYECSNSYIVLIPHSYRKENIISGLTEAAVSDLTVGKFVSFVGSSLGLSISSFYTSFLTSLPSVGAENVFELKLRNEDNSKTYIKVNPNQEIPLSINFSVGSLVQQWLYNDFKIDIYKQAGSKQYYDPNSQFNFYSSIELVTPSESQNYFSDISELFPYKVSIISKQKIKINEPGIYRVKLNKQGDRNINLI